MDTEWCRQRQPAMKIVSVQLAASIVLLAGLCRCQCPSSITQGGGAGRCSCSPAGTGVFIGCSDKSITELANTIREQPNSFVRNVLIL